MISSSNVCLSPANNYLFRVNYRNTRKRKDICSKLTMKTPKRPLMSLLLTLNIFETFFQCFYCLLSTSKCLLRETLLEFDNTLFKKDLHISYLCKNIAYHKQCSSARYSDHNNRKFLKFLKCFEYFIMKNKKFQKCIFSLPLFGKCFFSLFPWENVNFQNGALLLI